MASVSYNYKHLRQVAILCKKNKKSPYEAVGRYDDLVGAVVSVSADKSRV